MRTNRSWGQQSVPKIISEELKKQILFFAIEHTWQAAQTKFSKSPSSISKWQAEMIEELANKPVSAVFFRASTGASQAVVDYLKGRGVVFKEAAVLKEPVPFPTPSVPKKTGKILDFDSLWEELIDLSDDPKVSALLQWLAKVKESDIPLLDRSKSQYYRSNAAAGLIKLYREIIQKKYQ